MQLSKTEVEKIARLARLRLTDEEVERYRGELSAILGYIDQLNEVDTKGVTPTAQVTGLVNRVAVDEVRNQPRTEELLAGVPAREGDSIKVKAVFKERPSD